MEEIAAVLTLASTTSSHAYFNSEDVLKLYKEILEGLNKE